MHLELDAREIHLNGTNAIVCAFLPTIHINWKLLPTRTTSNGDDDDDTKNATVEIMLAKIKTSHFV